MEVLVRLLGWERESVIRMDAGERERYGELAALLETSSKRLERIQRMRKIADDYGTMQKLVTEGEERRQELEKRNEELELCLPAKEAKISEDGDLKAEVRLESRVEGELADLKA